MSLPRRLRRCLRAAPILAVVFFVACDAASPPAARIGDARITDQQVALETTWLGFLADLSGLKCGDNATGGETQAASCSRIALTRLVQRQLFRAAPGAGTTIQPSAAADLISRIDGRLGQEQTDKQLADAGMDRADLNALVTALLQDQASRRAVAEEELGTDGLQQLYEQHLPDATTVDAEHILVATEAEAEHVYELATAPGATAATFHGLAAQFSTDATTKDKGGALGSAAASTYEAPFASAVVALEPGQISKPVQTSLGWHVIRLISKQVQPIDAVKDQLLDSSSDIVMTWLQDEAKREGVVVNPRFGRFNPQTVSIVRISSTNASVLPTASPSPAA